MADKTQIYVDMGEMDTATRKLMYKLRKEGNQVINQLRLEVTDQCQLIVDKHRKKLLYQIGLTDDPYMDFGLELPKDDCYSQDSMDEDFVFKKRPKSSENREAEELDDKVKRPKSPQYQKKHTNLVLRQHKYPGLGVFDKHDGMHME